MPQVSIIILNWNGKKDTYECIKSIYKSSFTDFEIVLVDNNSSDSSVEFFKRKFPKTKFLNLNIVENPYNAGLAEGMNIGIRNAKCQLICLLGNDTIVDSAWLTELVSAIKSKNNIGIVGSCIKNLTGYDGKETCGEIINVFFQVIDVKKSNSETSYASLTSMLFKREIFEIAPFIPEYFGNYEDVYVSILARLKGYKVEITPKSHLLHKGGVSVSKVPTLMEFHMEKNAILTFFILYQSATIIKLLPVFISLNLSALTVSIIRGRLYNKLRSYIWVINNYSVILKYRRIVEKQRRINDSDLIRECMSYNLPINGRVGKFLSKIFRVYLLLMGIKTRELKAEDIQEQKAKVRL